MSGGSCYYAFAAKDCFHSAASFLPASARFKAGTRRSPPGDRPRWCRGCAQCRGRRATRTSERARHGAPRPLRRRFVSRQSGRDLSESCRGRRKRAHSTGRRTATAPPVQLKQPNLPDSALRARLATPRTAAEKTAYRRKTNRNGQEAAGIFQIRAEVELSVFRMGKPRAGVAFVS